MMEEIHHEALRGKTIDHITAHVQIDGAPYWGEGFTLVFTDGTELVVSERGMEGQIRLKLHNQA